MPRTTALIGPTAPPSIAAKPVVSRHQQHGGTPMRRMWGAIAVGAAILAGANSPAAARQNSCDGPILLGTTISVTGIFASLAGRWDKLTEMFEKEFNKDGGVFLS